MPKVKTTKNKNLTKRSLRKSKIPILVTKLDAKLEPWQYCLEHASEEDVQVTKEVFYNKNLVFRDHAHRFYAFSCKICDKNCTCTTIRTGLNCRCEKSVKRDYEREVQMKINWDFD
jgi:hypothetical protein